MKSADHLQTCLAKELAAWRRLSADEILERLEDEETYYETECEGFEFQVEVTLATVTEDFVQILISVDDGTLPRSLIPLTTTELIPR